MISLFSLSKTSATKLLIQRAYQPHTKEIKIEYYLPQTLEHVAKKSFLYSFWQVLTSKV